MMGKLKLFKEKYLTQKVRNIISVLVIIFGLTFFISYTFCEPTEINRLIATKIYKTPANSSFVDKEFYSCVINGYNSLEGVSVVDFSHNLTDEQLAMITDLTCSSGTITNITGINTLTGLNKLTLNSTLESIDLSSVVNLKELRLSDTLLTNVDLSKNTNLEYLYLNLSSFDAGKDELDLSYNTKLITLEIDNEISSIDLSKNVSLTNLNLENTNLSKITLGDVASLKTVNLSNNKLETIDLSKNTRLSTIDLSNNILSEIDVSKNVELISLILNDNEIDKIDLSMNEKLQLLDLSKSEFFAEIEVQAPVLGGGTSTEEEAATDSEEEVVLDGETTTEETIAKELDLSKNKALTNLNVSNFGLTKINLGDITNLEIVNLNDNEIENIDLSKNTLIKELYIANNKLTSLNLENNKELSEIDLSGNDFKQGLGVINGVSVLTTDLELYSIKFPDSIDVSVENISVDNENIEVSEDGVMTGLENGLYNATVTYNVNLGSISETIDVSTELVVYDIDTQRYKINKDKKYIYTGFVTDESKIISYIDLKGVDGLSLEVDTDNLKLFVNYNGFVIDTFDLANIDGTYSHMMIGSSPYLYYGLDEFDITKVNCKNCTINSTENNTLSVMYDGQIIDRIILVGVEISEDVYLDDYVIYGGIGNASEIEEFLANNIKCINCDYEYDSEIKKIKFTSNNELSMSGSMSEIIPTLSVARVISSRYDFTLDYLYYYDDTEDKILDNIDLNLISADIILDDIVFTYDNGTKELDRFKLVGVSSETYDLSNDYIYLGNNDYSDIITNNAIKCNNCQLSSIVDNKLLIKYNDEVIHTYEVVGLTSNYKIGQETIYVGDDYGNNDVILTKITSSTADISIDSDGDEDILVVKYNGEIVAEYKLSDQTIYLEFNSDVLVDDVNYIIKEINVDTTVDSLFSRIDTNAKYVVTNIKSEIISLSDVVGTGSVINFTMDDDASLSYKISVNGDVTGSGQLSVESMKRIAKHIIDGKELTENVHLLAADYDNDGQIKMNDVMRMLKDISMNTLYGDVNLNDKVDEDDLLVLMKYVNDDVKINDSAFWTSDLNLDLSIDETDYNILEAYIKSEGSFELPTLDWASEE